MEISKEKAKHMIDERIEVILKATNPKELYQFEYFAYGTATTMWELGIFSHIEHRENYDRIVAAVKTQKEVIK